MPGILAAACRSRGNPEGVSPLASWHFVRIALYAFATNMQTCHLYFHMGGRVG